MKRIKALILAAVVLAGTFVSCDDGKNPVDGTSEPTVTTSVDSNGTDSLPVSDTTSVQVTAEAVTTDDEVTEPTTAETTPPETEPTATEGMFMIDYAEKILGNYPDYDEYVWDDSYPVKAILYTDGVVTDVKLLKITENIDGAEPYTFEEVSDCGYITKDRPLVLTLSFFGDISPYGVSVTDAVGDTVIFRIEMSGFDGSLLLTEIG